jgi:hypothetical protein
MQRRSFFRTTGLTAGLMTLSSKEIFAAFLQQPAYKIKMLRGDVGIFSEKGGTIAFYQSQRWLPWWIHSSQIQQRILSAELKKLRTSLLNS